MSMLARLLKAAQALPAAQLHSHRDHATLVSSSVACHPPRPMLRIASTVAPSGLDQALSSALPQHVSTALHTDFLVIWTVILLYLHLLHATHPGLCCGLPAELLL